eukprot:TRINITY_DN8379_c0_g1_i1.p1 TRINITY_DN8379_c0_g1~~TRINITY_DN8379_c0_g1_i1.p1  ORF type:complete len:559 (+),score=17.46 TRINITY_DN8379_c0_g1_i1:50-1726(+)
MADVEGMTARNDSRHEPSSSAKKTDNTATSGYNLRERRRRPNPDYADFVAGMHRARFGDSDSYSDPPSTTKKEFQRVQTESHKRRKVGTAAPGPPPDPVVPAAWDTGFRSVPAICSLSSDKNPEAETLDPDRGDGGGDSPVVWQDAAGDPAPGSPPPHDDPIATATPISSLTLLAPPSRLSHVTSGSKEREVPDSDVAPVAGGKRVCNFRADWLRNVLQHRAPSSKPEKLPLAPQAQRPPRPTPNPAVTSDTACVGPSPLRHPPQGDASSSAIAVLLEMLRPLAKEGALHTLSNQALEDACRKLRVSIPSHRKADMIPRLCLRIGVHPDLKIEPRESSRHALPDRGPADAQDLKFEPQLGGEQPEDPGDGEPARPTSSGGQSDRTQSVRTPGHHGRLHPAYRSELLARGAHVTPIQTYAGRGSGSVSSADDDDASIPAPLALAHPKPSDLYRHEDHTDVVDGHARQCAEWLRRARRVVVLTGPPGPPDPRAKTWAAMRRLQPTATHAAVATLAARGHVAHVITTAVDDHHQRSGLPPTSSPSSMATPSRRSVWSAATA